MLFSAIPPFRDFTTNWQIEKEIESRQEISPQIKFAHC
jgi:hypothetical protein